MASCVCSRLLFLWCPMNKSNSSSHSPCQGNTQRWQGWSGVAGRGIDSAGRIPHEEDNNPRHNQAHLNTLRSTRDAGKSSSRKDGEAAERRKPEGRERKRKGSEGKRADGTGQRPLKEWMAGQPRKYLNLQAASANRS